MKLKIHYTFWLLAFVFLFSGLYLELFLFFSVILFHESGHLLWCFLFHRKTYVLNITAAGGLIEADITDLPVVKELLLYSGGISVNILLMVLSCLIKDDYYRELAYNYNLLMVIFNMLPVYPLDGYKILESLLSIIINRPFKEQKLLSFVSVVAVLVCFYYIITIKSYAFLILLLYLFIKNVLYHGNNANIALKKYIKRYRRQAGVAALKAG